MAFKNEYVPEADYEKNDLRRVCGEHNLLSRRGHMFANAWTIDRERDAFLIQVWSHHEAEFDGWAFYWKGEWIFFEMRVHGFKEDPSTSTDRTGYIVKGFSVPSSLAAVEVLNDFREALAVYRGAGVHAVYKGRNVTATIDFIGE